MSNRLLGEASPYLLQHAHNPVDWYPWGPEALGRAKRENKPILLSIGYTACHWCHVMERESFENTAIAEQMNRDFVCIKVDREERPDLDQTYQLVVQLMGRSGGWPLTVFLTPAQQPFFAGTYFPPADRFGMSGFPKILSALAEAYARRPNEVESQAAEIIEAMVSATTAHSAERHLEPSPALLARAAEAMGKRFDDVHGGFGDRPKFPNTMALDVLLSSAILDGAEVARSRTALALAGMRGGGIWDHLGYGFHRYSTDDTWTVPHFEKMLYDNALLIRLYAEAAQSLADPHLEATAREILAYLCREMVGAEGGMFSSQDADTEGEEGKYFVWTIKEVNEALADDAEARRAALAFYGVRETGNFEGGANVLSAGRQLRDVAAELALSEEATVAAIERARIVMFERREQRPKPFVDDKVLGSWNALAIGAIARCSLSWGDEAALAVAERAYACIRTKLWGAEGGHVVLARLRRGGQTRGTGFLDDYAYLADAALDLYEATGKPIYVADARALADAIVKRFYDDRDPGFFFTPSDGEVLVCRGKDAYDHAVPNPAAVACRVCLRLGALVDPGLAAIAERVLVTMTDSASQNPLGLSSWVLVIDRLARGSTDIVIVGAPSDNRTAALVRAAASVHLPHRNLARLDPGDPASLAACAVLAVGKPPRDAPVAYVCAGRACSLPIDDPAALVRALLPNRDTIETP
jgi:uncharacterized protein YyaL (SSP411 family)